MNSVPFQPLKKKENKSAFLIGIIFGFVVATYIRTKMYKCNETCCYVDWSNNHYIKLLKGESSNINDLEMDKKNNRNFLLIGVMTAKNLLDTRGKASWETWGKNVPGKVIFFSSKGSSSKYSVPFVSLDGVDDSYPPQKKAFMMLKYMHDHFINDFEYFMRVDDDMYMRPEKLETFLRGINSTVPLYIGQPGKGNKEEFGLLSLEEDENYCQGGPGMIMTRETMKRFVPNISKCIKNLYTTHEDVEIGRCIRDYANVSCTWAYETAKYFYHNMSGINAYTGELNDKHVLNALTLHPLKNPTLKYRLHNFFNMQKIIELRHKKYNLEREMKILENKIGRKNKIKIETKTSISRYNQNNFFYFTKKHVYSPIKSTPINSIETFWKYAINDIIRQYLDHINQNLEKQKEIYDIESINYGYQRQHPLLGSDFILNMQLKHNKHRKFTRKENQIAYFRRSFVDFLFSEDNSELNERTIHFVVSLSGRLEIFKRFMINYENVCLKTNENVKLAIVYFIENNTSIEEVSTLNTIKEIIDNLNNKYSINTLQLLIKNEKFSRSIGCNTGAALYNDDSLIFFIDVDLIFNRDTLLRVRLNTIQGKQVYFPIMLSKYNPSKDLIDAIKNIEINSSNYEVKIENGYWRQYSFGMSSAYNSDFFNSGGFDTSIIGWGKEDIDIYEKFLFSNVTIFRAIDPGLIHIYHNINCDPTLPTDQYNMCLGTHSTTLASLNKLVTYIYANKLY